MEDVVSLDALYLHLVFFGGVRFNGAVIYRIARSFGGVLHIIEL